MYEYGALLGDPLGCQSSAIIINSKSFNAIISNSKSFATIINRITLRFPLPLFEGHEILSLLTVNHKVCNKSLSVVLL